MSYQREYTKKLRVAVVGVGSHSYRNIIPTLHYLPVELVAICDINKEIAEVTSMEYGCALYTNTQEMYRSERLDAVFLCVSPKMHPSLAIEAFDADVNVWIEKPPAMRAFEVEEMIAHRKDRVCVVGFKKAFMPTTVKMVEIVNSTEYGLPLSILAVYPMSIPKNGEEILEKFEFTNWLGNGCHPLSFMLEVCGKVNAVTTLRSSNASGESGMIILEFENGVIGNFHFSSGSKLSERYSVFGNTWCAHIDNSLRLSLDRGYTFDYGRTTSYLPEGDSSGCIVWEPQNSLATLENKAEFTQGMYFEMKYFCDCILNKQAAKKGSLEFALEIMKVYEAALVSDCNRVMIY